MSKWKLLTCAACGNQMHCSSTSLPQGQAKCNPCRRDRGEWRPRSGSLVMRPCVVCDTEVQAPAVKCAAHKAWKRTTCSTCAVTNTRRKVCDDCRPLRTQVQKGKHRARARHFGVEYEEVNAHTVYERDNWVCGICHEPVDETLKWPDRMCASLDHIHPMSKGGGHTYANSQLAHHRCNTLKSNHVATARIAA